MQYKFAIELSKVDIQLIYKIKTFLGVGSITECSRCNPSGIISSFARLKVSSKKNLLNVIIPIFTEFPFITHKYYDFLHFQNCLI